MKNKLLTLFLALAASVGTIFAETYNGTCGDNLTWTLDTESGTLTISGTGAMTDYDDSYAKSPWYSSYRTSIKTVIIEDGVASIGNYAFDICSSLTFVTIPNSVTSIGDWAFSSCSSLTSITIPNSVTSIGVEAFYNCRSLTSVHISDIAAWCKIAFSRPFSNPLYYAQNLYLNGTLITDLVIPNSVTSIGSYAFWDCSSLTSVTISNSVTIIEGAAFSSCSSLTSITIPNSVTSIGEWAFSNCIGLTSVTIPNSVTSIGRYAFEYCRSLTSVTIPNSVTSIGDWAFYECYSLTSITVDSKNPNYCDIDGVLFNKNKTTLIQYPADKSATSYTIPNSVTSIGHGAFSLCYSLTSITIPNSVISIGYAAFYYCSSLTYITCEAVNPPTLGDNAFEGVNKSIPLYVPSSSVQQYKLAKGWKDFTNIQPISSQSGDVTTPTVTVTTTSADIAWPQISGAASYELVIKDKSGNVVCTLVFDAEGHLTSLNFGAPDRDNIRKQPQAGTFSYTVTGLKENTEYTYTLTAKDSQGKAIDTKTGTFKTIGGTPVDETERDAAPAPRKLLKNGILRILTPDGTAYDLQGQRID